MRAGLVLGWAIAVPAITGCGRHGAPTSAQPTAALPTAALPTAAQPTAAAPTAAGSATGTRHTGGSDAGSATTDDLGDLGLAGPPSMPPHPHVPPVDAPPRPAPTIIASGRHEPKHLVADDSGATWVETTDDVSTVFHVRRTGKPTKLATVRGDITALGLGPGGALYAGLRRGESMSIVRLRGGKIEPFAKTDGIVEALAVDDAAVYWAGGGGAFARIAIKGHATKEIASSVEYSFADHVEVDGTYFYWSNELDDTPRRIYRVPKLGGEVEQVNTTAVGVWTLTDNGPALVSDEVTEAAYASGVTWALRDSDVVVLAP